MGADADYLTFFEDDDFIGVADCGETVGDDYGGATGDQFIEAFLNFGCGDGIEGAGWFIEDDDLRGFEDGASNGYTLLLSAGEPNSPFSDEGVVAFWEFLDELVSASKF